LMEVQQYFPPGEVCLVCLDNLPNFTDLPTQYISSGQWLCELLFDEHEKLFVLKSSTKGGTFISPTRYIHFGEPDGSLKLFSSSTSGPLSSVMVETLLVSFDDLHQGKITHVQPVYNGKLLVTTGQDGTCSIWRVRKTAKEGLQLEQEACNVGVVVPGNAITSLHVSTAQGVIVCGGSDGGCTVWDLGKRHELIRMLHGHDKPVKFVQVNPMNGNVFTMCEDLVNVWHVNGALLANAHFKSHHLSTPVSMTVTSCPTHQPGVVLLIGHAEGEVSLWDLKYPNDMPKSKVITLELRAQVLHTSGIPVMHLQLSRDQRMFVGCNANGDLKRWASGESVVKKYRHLVMQGGLLSSIGGGGRTNASMSMTS
jgi:WD40 repeat protein